MNEPVPQVVGSETLLSTASIPLCTAVSTPALRVEVSAPTWLAPATQGSVTPILSSAHSLLQPHGGTSRVSLATSLPENFTHFDLNVPGEIKRFETGRVVSTDHTRAERQGGESTEEAARKEVWVAMRP